MVVKRTIVSIGGCIVFWFLSGHAPCSDAPTRNSEGNRSMPNPTTSDQTNHAIVMSREQAAKAVADAIGLVKYDLADVHVEVAPLSHESLPCLAKPLRGQDTLRIVFKNLSLPKASGRAGLINPHIRNLVVFLAPASGHVMKVTSVWPQGVPRIAEFPSCVEEERQMGDFDRYTGLPMGAPKCTLFDAIAKSRPWSNNVKQIHACYVLHSNAFYKDRPVWVVQLRGFGPMPFSLPGGVEGEIPEDGRNHLRNIVDAETGEWLGADTIPQPAGPLENRY